MWSLLVMRSLGAVGVGLVQLGVSDRFPIDVEVLVIDWKLLEYNLLLGVDIIKSVCNQQWHCDISLS